MLSIRKFLEGIGIVPKSSSTADTQGELEVLSSDGKLRYHNGTSVSPVVTEAHSATLTNKTIDADSNTITNIENADIKAGAAIDASKIADGSVSSTEFQYLANVTSDIQTQLNSKASGTLNEDHVFIGNASNAATPVNTTLVGDIEADVTAGLTIKSGVIVNADINASAAIDATKIADGSVTNTEFQYLSGVTSDIQTQLNSTVTASSTNTLTNKTIDGDDNTVQDLALSSLKTNLTDANKFLVRDGSGIVVSNTKDVPTGAVVGTTDTQTLTNKTVDVLTYDDQASTPSNPSAGFYKTYFKTDGKLYKLDSSGTETEVGSGGPGFTAGLNLMLLNTAANNWSADKTNNFNAEVSVGDWVAYADAAGTSPVDMTGGSPNTTISRTTTNEINGIASFEMAISSGATRQGEGVSCLVNIPTAYRGKTLTFKFPYTLTGTVSEDDLRLFAYDVTNSLVLTPYSSGKILGTSGMAQCTIDVASTAAQIRVGIHIARASNTGAVTMQFDDVVLSLDSTPVGLAGSDWIAYTPTFSSSWGTVSSISAFYRRVGDSIDIAATFTNSSPGSGVLTVGLPPGLTSAGTDKIRSGGQIVGDSLQGNGNSYQWIPVIKPSQTSFNYSKQGGSVAGIGTDAQASDLGTGTFSTFCRGIPIAGWSANVNMAEASTFLMGPFLANGTRVTTTPTRIGEYRTLIKDNAARTMSDNDGSGAISAANGMRIYSVSGTGAGTSGQPNKYVIFVGKNKVVKPLFYSSAGRTGHISTDYHYISSTDEAGVMDNYDPTTGLYTIQLPLNSSSASRSIGTTMSASTGVTTSATDCYFDLLVSENALAVGTQNPRSEVFVGTGNGHGSTNNKIRRFSTTFKSNGNAITYADSSTLGASFTINETGVYSITYTDVYSASIFPFGISVNSSVLTTSITSVTYAQGSRGFVHSSGAGFTGCFSISIQLNAGDVVRPHTNGQADSTTAGEVIFSIAKVSN